MKIARFELWSYADLLHRDHKRSEASQATTQWVSAIDIIEEKSQFTLRADLPDASPGEVEITMNAGFLSVSGARATKERREDAQLRHNECISGRFFRQFNLSDTSDADNLESKCNNGTLEVVILKLPEIAARRISMEAA